MTCPHCGRSAPADSVRCPACGTALAHSGTVAGTIAIDATGVPPGATFGATPTSLPPDTAASSGGPSPSTYAATPTSLPPNASAAAPPIGGTMATVGATALTGETAHGDGTPRSPSGPLRVGQAFGQRYHIIKVLGVGGMGAVYQSWDAELGVAVALKVIRTDRRRAASPELEKRFKNELLLARKVTHKNVVRIHDLGEIDGIKYITMPYIQGDDLATILRKEGKLPVARALRIARQVAGGLEAAHEAGVVHRDLKPPNIMISGSDDELQALIMDFGISASATEAAEGGITGTLEYMAPEQATSATVDGRADIYAFGLILYEMLTGPRPIAAATAHERVEAMKYRFANGLPPIRAVDESIAEPLASVVMRCLEIDPAARFQTAVELSAALAALDDQGELIPIPPRFSKTLIAGAVSTVIALVTATWYFTRTPPLPKQHDPVSVVVADFKNSTGDAAFKGSIEQPIRIALEGSGFITAYDRSQISRTGAKAPETMDEEAAREIAIRQGLGVVLSGEVARRGSDYAVSVKAIRAVTGAEVTKAEARVKDKSKVLSAATNLMTRVRKALGDDTDDSAQRFAMDTLSATSLEVVQHYAAAMEALSNSEYERAEEGFTKAIELDPKFGIGYQGLAVVARDLDRHQQAETYSKESLRHLDGMTERERYRTRGLYYMVTEDYQACVKEYSDLIGRFPADVSARNNLAQCQSYLRNLPKAVAEMKQVVQIIPKRNLYRENLSFYSTYASDFEAGEREARAIQQPGMFGLLALAYANIGQGRLPVAFDTYEQIRSRGAQGASYAASGLGDLAIYEGRFSDALRIFTEGAAADLEANERDRAATKYVALAYAHVLRGQKAQAAAAATKALANSQTMKIRFFAARAFVEADQIAKARAIAMELISEAPVTPQAYGKIIEGLIALKSRDAKGAVKSMIEANTLLDTWIGHFDLGRAYLAAGQFTQADSEFDRCVNRRGESISLFLDEEPTAGYFPPVYYYQGRVREELKTAGFAESYRTYLSIREGAGEDPLLADARRRAGQ